MRLNVTSLRGIELEGDIRSLNIKTSSGEITILDHHRPLVTVLEAGAAHIVDAKGSEKKITIKGGFLEVSPGNIINALVD